MYAGKLSKQWKDNEELEKVGGIAYFYVCANAPIIDSI